jgi:hypothetical protein
MGQVYWQKIGEMRHGDKILVGKYEGKNNWEDPGVD